MTDPTRSGAAPDPAAPLKYLLDEHYPGWLADELVSDGIDAVAVIAHRPELRGRLDSEVLQAAAREQRVVVTEDVSTFAAAIAAVPHHCGVIYCHHRRFPRTRPGLALLRRALVDLAVDPPGGLGRAAVVWWADPAGGRA
jgi:hypothetical protein